MLFKIIFGFFVTYKINKIFKKQANVIFVGRHS